MTRAFLILLFAVAQNETPDTLIPLDMLLGPPSYLAPLLSPDGTKIAYIAPYNEVPNIYIAPTDDFESGHPLTKDTDRGISPSDVSGNITYRWAGNDRILYLGDTAGEENFHLYSVDVNNGKISDLTPVENAQVRIIKSAPARPDEILIGINDRRPAFHDVYLLNIKTGKRTLVERNKGYVAYSADNDLELRIAIKVTLRGTISTFTRDPDGDWVPFILYSDEDEPGAIVGFDEDSKTLYMRDSRERDTAALLSIDLRTGVTTVLASDSKVDIGKVLLHPQTHTPVAYATNWTRTKWHPLNESVTSDLAYLENLRDGDLEIVSQDAANNQWIVKFVLSDAPATYYLYDRHTRTAKKLFVSHPELESLPMAKMHPVVIPSRDGFDLVSYVTLPRWFDVANSGRPQEPIPMIVIVHGGPSDERAMYMFAPLVQWLANRGYAVFVVNFRGSPGFGKRFMNAQRLEWGGKMHDDIVDQVRWAINARIADPEKIGILGGSYGGYETLVAMTFTPELFACGVSVVGPSNLESFIDTIPPHWSLDHLARRIGDPRTPPRPIAD